MAQTSTTLALWNGIQRHPYRSVLVAAGVGYVLGGGLFTRLTLNVVRAGLRMGALPLLQRELIDVAELALATPTGAAADDDANQTPRNT